MRRKPWDSQSGSAAAEGVDGAMVADVELRALPVELGLGAVARVRQAGAEHRGDEGHGRLIFM